MRKVFEPSLWAVLITAVISAPLQADDAFPITGIYVENRSCNGNPEGPRVKISPDAIESDAGKCIILSRRRNGRSIAAQVQCRTGSGEIIVGDVTFTMRDDQTVAISDQDNVYSAVLFKCP